MADRCRQNVSKTAVNYSGNTAAEGQTAWKRSASKTHRVDKWSMAEPWTEKQCSRGCAHSDGYLSHELDQSSGHATYGLLADEASCRGSRCRMWIMEVPEPACWQHSLHTVYTHYGRGMQVIWLCSLTSVVKCCCKCHSSWCRNIVEFVLVHPSYLLG